MQQVPRFYKDQSVFKAWYNENAAREKESIDIDCSLWKLHKFIKGDEDQILACKKVIMKH